MDLLAFVAASTVWCGAAALRSARPEARSGKDTTYPGVDRTLRGTIARLSTRYGLAIRHEFQLDPAFVHLNHGSYGTAPRRVVRAARGAMDAIESYPDHFFRRTALPQYVAVCNEVGRWLRAPPNSVVIVDNATQAVNTVLRAVAVDLQPGDVLLANNHTYAACRNALVDTATRAGASVVTAHLPMPARTPDELVAPLVAAVEGVLSSGRTLRFVLLDHITSPTALVVPVAAIARAVKARAPGCVVMVDGAHAPAQLELHLGGHGARPRPDDDDGDDGDSDGDRPRGDGDLRSVDYYTGNLHKWAFCVKGCAFLYAAPHVQHATQGPSVSHFWKRPFQERFFMQGTNDLSRWLAIPEGLRFMRDVLGGEAAMREYNGALARAGAQLCSAAWGGTGTLLPEGASPSLCAPFLVPVRMPLDVRRFLTAAGARGMSAAEAAAAADSDDGLNERVSASIFARARIQAQVVWWQLQVDDASGMHGALFVRLSAQVYNTLDDYAALAGVVQEMAAEEEPLARTAALLPAAVAAASSGRRVPLCEV